MLVVALSVLVLTKVKGVGSNALAVTTCEAVLLYDRNRRPPDRLVLLESRLG